MASPKAISSFRVALMHSVDGMEYNKLYDIKDCPALGAEPEKLDTTTLSDAMRTYIAGIQDVENLVFTANYSSDGFDMLAEKTGKIEHYAVWFGGTGSGAQFVPDGSQGKFTFDGDLHVYVDSMDLNDVADMKITIVPATEIKKVKSE